MEQPRRFSPGFFTLLELLIVIAVISILLAILLPALRGAMEAGKRIACVNKGKQIAFVVGLYVEDYAGRYPNASGYWPQTWTVNLAVLYKYGDYAANKLTVANWTCPSYRGYPLDYTWGENSTYGMNLNSFSDSAYDGTTHYNAYLPAGRIRSPSEHLLLTETLWNDDPTKGDYRANAGSGWARVAGIHQGFANTFFCDGHSSPLAANWLNTLPYTETYYKEPWNYGNK